MSHSLNEVEAMARRAARGAGYDWGLAEEAGKAVRWLCANGLDGCAPLARLLDSVAGLEPRAFAPRSAEGEWQGQEGWLCPLAAGAALSDFAALLGKREITMQDLREPALVLPFASAAAARLGGPITLAWANGHAACTREACEARAAPLLDTPLAAWLRVGAGGTVDATCARAHRAHPDMRAWASLESFARRTYAPATDASRRLGAGAGPLDND